MPIVWFACVHCQRGFRELNDCICHEQTFHKQSKDAFTDTDDHLALEADELVENAFATFTNRTTETQEREELKQARCFNE